MDEIVYRILLFDCFALDLARGCLRTDDRDIDLRPKTFRVLRHLAENAGRLVPKQELYKIVWPNVVVSDDSLVQCVRELRQALGDDKYRLIKTVSRRGYLLDVTVTTPDLPAASASAVATNSAAASLVPSLHQADTKARPSLSIPDNLPDKPSIAVLPFSNLSPDPSQDYFSDGITEDIIIELSRFSELFVIARNSSFQYKGKSIDVRQVGRELGVRYVLEGSIRRVGKRVRFAAELVDAVTGAHRWAERYDRELKDVFAVQDEVARTIVAVLAAHVNKAEAERTALKPPATWQAYDYYMRAADGIAAFQRHGQVATIYETRRLIERCLAIDPDFARAYDLQSRTQVATWGQQLDADYMNPAVLEAAHRAAERAVQLDANLAPAHYQLGFVLSFKAQREAAVAACERAVALNPNYVDRRFAGVLVHAGQPERAIHVAKAHLRLDPFALPIGRGWLGLAYYLLRRYGEAVAPLRELVTRSPNYRPGRAWLAATYAQLGRLEEARAEAAEVLRLDPSWTSSTIFRKGGYLIDEDVDHLVDGLHKAGLPEK